MAGRQDHDPVGWFDEHYTDAADEVLAFLSADGISLEGKDVADVGCGDGVIDLGLVHKGKPRKLVGYDVRPVDTSGLTRAARAAGVGDPPESLNFLVSDPLRVPALNESFDVVVTWSTFEHVDDPTALLAEIARIMKPDGVLFLQLWPFWFSEHGGHLWPHYDDPFPHLVRHDTPILDDLVGERGTDPTRPADDEYRSLNRLTLDQLQLALLANGLAATKVKLMTNTVHIPLELIHIPLSHVAVAGVELLAVRRDEGAR